jgi:hypothetical protein
MINPQWGFNPIIIRMLFAVTLLQQSICMVSMALFSQITHHLDNFHGINDRTL